VLRCRPLAAPLILLGFPTALALIAACVVVVTLPRLEASRRDRTALDFRNLSLATEAFQRRMGRPPLGASELVAKTLFEREPRDVWDRPFRYFILDGRPVWASLGRDGRCGGYGPDRDVFSESAGLSRQACEARDQ
jgi:general secretion pathway protein G